MLPQYDVPPTESPIPRPTAVPTATSTSRVVKKVITHSVGFPVTAEEWTLLQSSFETAYCLSIGIVNNVTHQLVTGATIESTIARRAITATFKASLDPTSIGTDSAMSAASSMTAETLVTHANAAAVKANLNLHIPAASALTVQKPVMTVHTASTDDSDAEGDALPVFLIAGAAAGAVALLAALTCFAGWYTLLLKLSTT